MNNDTFIHSIDEKPEGFPIGMFLGVLLIVILAGTGVGYGISQIKGKKTTQTSSSQKVNTEKAAGIVDKKTFKDSAEGILREGGIDGEGNFHVERPGGVSQNIYATSSTVDLSQFVGKKVKVYGQTFKGQKAGWLMDVGLVEVQ